MLVCACVKESQCQCMYVRVCVRNFIDNNNVIYIWCGSMKMKAECEMKSSLPLRVNLCGFMLVVLLYLHILVKHFIHTAVTNQNIWAFFWALCLYIVKKKKMVLLFIPRGKLWSSSDYCPSLFFTPPVFKECDISVHSCMLTYDSVCMWYTSDHM